MTAKKKPTTPESSALDHEAQDIHDQIDQQEGKAAPLYWQLGEIFSEIRKQPEYKDWKSFLKHCDSISLRRSRVTRAIRIRKRHKKIQDVCDKSLDKALDYNSRKPKDKKTHTKQPLGAPLSTPEYQAAMRFENLMGSRERVVEVLRMYFAGEKPAEETNEGEATEPVKPIAPVNPADATTPVEVTVPVGNGKFTTPTDVHKNGSHRSMNGKAPHGLRVVGSRIPKMAK